MQAMASLVSTVITLLLNWTIGQFGGIAAIGILVASCVAGTLVSFLLKEQLNKTNNTMLTSGSFFVSLVPREQVEEDNHKIGYEKSDAIRKKLSASVNKLSST
jgi:hypothetical protein